MKEAMMLEVLSRYWWTLALRGAVAVLFGVLALFWPQITLTVLVLLFGAYALVDGLVALGTVIFGGGRAAGRRPWLILEGILGVAAGVVTFVWPQITAVALLALIAAWAVLTGVVELVAAVRLRREIEGEWLLALSGALSVIFGVLIVIWPGAGALAVVWLIGIYAIIFGVTLLMLGFRLRRLRNVQATPGTHAHLA
jgi:uncharacterized membrane protein HdeD (DUF308 family)